MSANRKPCGAPHAHGHACDRPAKHDGQHAATVDGERFYWGRPSGPSGATSARARESGLRRVEAYLSPEAAAGLDRLKGRLGSARSALEWALTTAKEPRP